jgi:hypothetical protein
MWDESSKENNVTSILNQQSTIFNFLHCPDALSGHRPDALSGHRPDALSGSNYYSLLAILYSLPPGYIVPEGCLPEGICLFCLKSNGRKISCPLMELTMKKFSNRTRCKGIFVCYLIDPRNNQIPRLVLHPSRLPYCCIRSMLFPCKVSYNFHTNWAVWLL